MPPRAPSARHDLDDDALTRIYTDMRRTARRRVQQSGVHSIQATELANEAYLRLRDRGYETTDRTELFHLAARAMRDILVERARRRRAAKRGGDWKRISWEAAPQMALADPESLLSLHDVLLRLQMQSESLARVVELLYFGGFTIAEAADALGTSTSTIDRRWHTARAWLHAELTQSP